METLMSEVATVAVGWGVTALAVASYALWVLTAAAGLLGRNLISADLRRCFQIKTPRRINDHGLNSAGRSGVA